MILSVRRATVNQTETAAAGSFPLSVDRGTSVDSESHTSPRHESHTRVAVLGLDGVPFPLLESLFDAGVMPRLAEVAQAGSFVKMRTTSTRGFIRSLDFLHDGDQSRSTRHIRVH